MSEENRNPEIEKLGELERERVGALVNGDLETTRRLHADDYELITSFGIRLSKEQYIAALDALEIRYLFWNFDSEMKVRLYTEVALIRYQATIELAIESRRVARTSYWYTAIYEKHADRWQAIWSQETEIP